MKWLIINWLALQTLRLASWLQVLANRDGGVYDAINPVTDRLKKIAKTLTR